MRDLCAVGDLHWLIVCSRLSRPGTGTPAIERLFGNDAAIVSTLAARSGLSCSLFPTNVIALSDGQPLLNVLRQAGVDISQIDTRGVTTPTTFLALHLDSYERVFRVTDYAFRAHTSRSLPASRWVYLDLYEKHLQERLALLHTCLQAGARCLVNLSASSIEEKARLLTTMPSLDVVQIGGSWRVEEARIKGSQIRQMCRAQAVVITLGSRGVVLVDQHGDEYIPAEPIRPLRTIGAGASFAAGLLAKLARGATCREAARFASREAAAFCTLRHNPLAVRGREEE